MMKLRSKRFCRSFSSSKIKAGTDQNKGQFEAKAVKQVDGEIKWELRPGGMLVQRRETQNAGEGMITVKVSTVSQWHDISVEPTSTFGKLSLLLSCNLIYPNPITTPYLMLSVFLIVLNNLQAN